jgi:hypothetical protein
MGAATFNRCVDEVPPQWIVESQGDPIGSSAGGSDLYCPQDGQLHPVNVPNLAPSIIDIQADYFVRQVFL